jgi:hypothetical protein
MRLNFVPQGEVLNKEGDLKRTYTHSIAPIKAVKSVPFRHLPPDTEVTRISINTTERFFREGVWHHNWSWTTNLDLSGVQLNQSFAREIRHLRKMGRNRFHFSNKDSSFYFEGVYKQSEDLVTSEIYNYGKSLGFPSRISNTVVFLESETYLFRRIQYYSDIVRGLTEGLASPEVKAHIANLVVRA